jgi:bisphosphoglycerate-independent phosphoglycerate mutase (AlkP superfamily)
MQLNENEQKVYKLVTSIKNKNKVKDLSLVYNYAYSLKVTDESIQKILLLASW